MTISSTSIPAQITKAPGTKKVSNAKKKPSRVLPKRKRSKS